MAIATAELLEYTATSTIGVRHDPATSTIRGVKVLGLESRNGRSYTPAAARSAISLYENARVNVNHGKAGSGPRDYQDRIGTLINVRFVEGRGLFADLRYNPKHPMAEQLVWDAENSPGSVGLSHNASGRTRQERGRTIVEQITAVHSVDLVSDPATTSGLFESVGHPSRAPDNRTFLERLRNKPSAESVAEFAEAVLGRAVWKRRQQEIHESAAQLGRRYRS